MSGKRKPLAVRLWEKVATGWDFECWEWQAGRSSFGYGRISEGGARGKPLFAHRVSWEFFHGTIPAGMSVLHRCDNPPCVNPNHLYLGTHQDNVDDMYRRGRAAVGKAHGKAKLTDAEVRDIRSAKGTQQEIADRYGISRSHVSNIKTGRYRARA